MTRRSSTGSTGRTSDSCDAVVIGAGHNGLVAATHLADAGWDVVVVEASTEAGGAVKTDRRLDPEFHAEVMKKLGLDRPALQRYTDWVGGWLQGRSADSVS